MAKRGRHAQADPADAGRYSAPVEGSNFVMPEKPSESKGPWKVVFRIAVVVLIASLVALGAIVYQYWSQQQTYNELSSAFDEPAGDFTLDQLTVDWEQLRAVNPEVCAWIFIPGTVVNYPVCHTTDDQKYLNTSFKGETGWLASAGTIFLEANNKADFSDKNNFLYGHHMNDGSMFAVISSLANNDEFNAHRTVYVLTPQGNYQLTTFSLVITDGSDVMAQTGFSDAAAYSTYINDKFTRSVVTQVGSVVTPESVKKSFALSTCDYTINDGRAVLFASVVDTTVARDKTLISAGDSLISEADATAIYDAAREEAA